MISKRINILFLILLLVTTGLPAIAGCADNTSNLPLGEALQGRYTVTDLDMTTHEWDTVAYLELTDGRYSLIPNESSDKLIEEVAINFFAENPTGTYTLNYFQGITENTTLEDLDESENTNLLTVFFKSSISDQRPLCNFRISFNTSSWEHFGHDKKPRLYMTPNISIFVSYEISRPWEE